MAVRTEISAKPKGKNYQVRVRAYFGPGTRKPAPNAADVELWFAQKEASVEGMGTADSITKESSTGLVRVLWKSVTADHTKVLTFDLGLPNKGECVDLSATAWVLDKVGNRTGETGNLACLRICSGRRTEKGERKSKDK